jgi:HEPN domain-containing protein
VNNLDTGERLLSRAHEYYDEMLRAYERRSWNVVMRRAQEVVELSFKGLLKMMGVEYPKSHDVGWLFGRVCIEMGLKVESKELEVLKDISFDLAEARSPAFYEERIYNKQDADKAKAGAEKVLNFAESFAKTLRN